MDHTTISASLNSAKFLGSKDRILVSGNNPSTNLQIQYSSFVNGVNGKKQFKKISEATLAGACTALELCGIPRLGKTFAAVAKTDRANKNGSISLIDVETGVNSAHLQTHDDEEYTLFDGFCPYTSLSFLSDREILAVGSESGEIILFDLYVGKEVTRIKADPSGVNKLRFMRTGQLISLGNSSKSQVRIWDLKSNGAGQVLHLSDEISSGRSSSGSNSPMNTSSNNRSTQQLYSSVCPHPVQNTVMCGTTEGEVVLWDLRNASSSSLEFRPHHCKGETR